MSFEVTPKPGSKVVVAMSGGVDSSVSAAWLKKQGYEVIGISLQLHDYSAGVENKYGTCCSSSDIYDARRVAERIGIPFYVMDMESLFSQAVIDDFIHEYSQGRTPNPCVKCNEKVKFSQLMDWAMDLGADYLATGHYAVNRYNEESGEYELCKGKDPDKDQSYFLFMLSQEDLKKTIFPVGNMTKSEVRELARRLDLAVADKPDSQEICFVPSGDYADFVKTHAPHDLLKPGPIQNTKGQVLGEHQGLHAYTIGQRKGLGVQSLEALYVVEINPTTNTLVLGSNADLFRKKCLASQMKWVGKSKIAIHNRLDAKIRYRALPTPAIIEPILDKRVSVEFETPQRAITPGQALVLYDRERVVGGGWIEASLA